MSCAAWEWWIPAKRSCSLLHLRSKLLDLRFKSWMSCSSKSIDNFRRYDMRYCASYLLKALSDPCSYQVPILFTSLETLPFAWWKWQVNAHFLHGYCRAPERWLPFWHTPYRVKTYNFIVRCLSNRCFMQFPYNPDVFMLCCGECNEW